MSQQLNELIKSKKESMLNSLKNLHFNFPHRLGEISTSGSLTYVIDERDFTTVPTSPKLKTFTVDFSLMPVFLRLIEPDFVWSGSTPPSGAPGDGEFYMYHRPLYPWEVKTNFGGAPDNEVVGNTNIKTYNSGGDLVSDDDFDIDGNFVMFMSQGGDTTSHGRNLEDSTEKVYIEFNESLSGTNSTPIPSFGFVIYRFPWDGSWSSETTQFSDILAAAVSAGNTADGGGHSGSSSASLDFTNLA